MNPNTTQIVDIVESSLIRIKWCLKEKGTKEEQTRYLNDGLEGLKSAVFMIENEKNSWK